MLKCFTLLYIALLAVVVAGANLGILSPFVGWVHSVPFGDKTCHFLFVGFLSFLISASLSLNLRKNRKRTVVLSTIVILAVLSSIEEASQSLFASRQFSEYDMLANIAGICVFGGLALLLPSALHGESDSPLGDSRRRTSV